MSIETIGYPKLPPQNVTGKIIFNPNPDPLKSESNPTYRTYDPKPKLVNMDNASLPDMINFLREKILVTRFEINLSIEMLNFTRRQLKYMLDECEVFKVECK